MSSAAKARASFATYARIPICHFLPLLFDNLVDDHALVTDESSVELHICCTPYLRPAAHKPEDALDNIQICRWCLIWQQQCALDNGWYTIYSVWDTNPLM